MSRVAAVAGATGLVGTALVRCLSTTPEYGRVLALVRRAVALPPAVEAMQTELASVQLQDMANVEDVFCCIGTTIRKAGSREAFRAVDHDAVLHLAGVARLAGAKRFLLVSSVDASPQSPNFYLRVKGELEASLKQQSYEALYLFRPSFLIGERAEARWGERTGIAVARAVSPLLMGSLRRYKPVRVDLLAESMVRAALDGEPGQHILHYDDFVRLRDRR